MENADNRDVLEPRYKDLVNKNSLLSDEVTKLEQELDLYKFRYNELRAKVFGSSSEKKVFKDLGHTQPPLLEIEEDKPEEDSEEEYTEVKSHKKKKRGKKKEKFLALLPTDEYVYEPEETTCSCCGLELKEFSRDTRVEIDFKPSFFFKREIVKINKSCPGCKSVKSGKTPSPVLAGTEFGPSFFAHLITTRFVDHQPYYRQSQIYEREGVIIPDKYLSRYAMLLAKLLEPVAKEIKKYLFSEEYLQIDETRLEVLAKDKLHRGQLWVLNSPSSLVSYYEYQKSRSEASARAVIGDYKGVLQSDAYSVYNNLSTIGCLVHARRRFIEASKLSISKKDANHILKLISSLYKIEKNLKFKRKDFKSDLDWFNERLKTRKKKAAPVLEKIKSYLSTINQKYVVQGHPMYNAINYMLPRFSIFETYTTNGMYQIDNNDVERVIRPIAVGRKNWLFSGSEQGAKNSAILMTVVKNCMNLKINPQRYLEDVLPKLADRKTTSLKGLTPMDWAEKK